jgi:hypothetical protein
MTVGDVNISARSDGKIAALEIRRGSRRLRK